MDINLTLIGQAIAFALFVWFCMKFVWPPITAALAERQKKIAEGLNAADKAQRDLEAAHAAVAAELKSAKAEAAVLIEQATRRGNQIVEEAKAQAQVEADRVKAMGLAQLEQDVVRAKDALRAQVASLAVAGAEKILGVEVNAEKHAALLQQLATEL